MVIPDCAHDDIRLMVEAWLTGHRDIALALADENRRRSIAIAISRKDRK